MTTYVRLRDAFPDDDKVSGLSDGAFRLYVTALCYASRNLTDGFVPRTMIKRFGSTMNRAGELLESGLWKHPDGRVDGWMIHNYLKHQRSKAHVEELSALKKEAGIKSGAARRNKVLNTPSANGEHSVQNNNINKSRSISRDRDNNRVRAKIGDSARQWYQAVEGKPPPPALRGELDELWEKHGAECIAAAFQAGADADHPWRYTKAIFAACQSQGHLPRNVAVAAEDEMDELTRAMA